MYNRLSSRFIQPPLYSITRHNRKMCMHQKKEVSRIQQTSFI